MSDPIALIQSIVSDGSTTATDPSTSTALSSSSPTPASTTSTPDYTLSPSLSSLISQGSSLGLTGNSLATYNVQSLLSQNQSSLLSTLPTDNSGEAAFFNQLSLYQQYLTTARANTAGAAQAAATATPDPLASVLSDAHSNNQASTSAGGTANSATNTGLAGIDASLAQTVGYAQTLLDQ
ncbi:MAG TPA: hypothetical protein VN931_02600 [Fibrobacteria bacterium]|nr:hypothetical protein [Fibrobacteria bacterium]